ncbi:MAG TPA: class I SAM-dependent methyltransferase [Terriglobales bacterium]|nr:class I SAM-dependent methyltransferase [Terriglobales bacterium]
MNCKAAGTLPLMHSGSSADAVAYHGCLAVGWERRYQKSSFRSRETLLSRCLEGCHLRGTLWLDAGCGTGTLSRWLAARGCRVLGVDAASEMVTTAALFAHSTGFSEHVRFARINTIAQLPAPDKSVDGILCSSVLEYVPDPTACLTEFARVLKPGGRLLVSVPNRNSIVRRFQVTCHRLADFLRRDWLDFLDYSRQEFSASEFEALLARTGFALNRLLPFGSPLPDLAQRSCIWGPLLMFVAKKL